MSESDLEGKGRGGSGGGGHGKETNSELITFFLPVKLNYTQLTNLFEVDGFEAFMMVLATNKLRDSIYGMVMRVSIGACLSMIDITTDLFVVTTYFKLGLTEKAISLLSMIMANTFLQLVIVWGQVSVQLVQSRGYAGQLAAWSTGRLEQFDFSGASLETTLAISMRLLTISLLNVCLVFSMLEKIGE